MFFEVPQSTKTAESPSDGASDGSTSLGAKKRKVKPDENIAFPPRTSKACDRCRVKKTRCLADVDGTACKKCKREGAICTFAQESKPDTKARSSPAYVQMLEGERRILIQALRELSIAKGDITALNPGMRIAIEKLQLHNIVPKEELEATETKIEDQDSPRHELLNGGMYTGAPSTHMSAMTQAGFQRPNDMSHTFQLSMYSSASLPPPEYIFTPDEMAEIGDLSFRDYPLEEIFGYNGSGSYRGNTG